MNVDFNSWHAKLYRLWYGLKYYESEVPSGTITNLCPYMRAVLLWSWLRFFFLNGKIKKCYVSPFVYALLLVEIPRWLGMWDYWYKIIFYRVELIGLGVVALLAFLVVITLGLSKLEDRGVFEAAGKPFKVAGEKTTGFFKLLNSYIHDRFCPQIKIVTQDYFDFSVLPSNKDLKIDEEELNYIRHLRLATLGNMQGVKPIEWGMLWPYEIEKATWHGKIWIPRGTSLGAVVFLMNTEDIEDGRPSLLVTTTGAGSEQEHLFAYRPELNELLQDIVASREG